MQARGAGAVGLVAAGVFLRRSGPEPRGVLCAKHGLVVATILCLLGVASAACATPAGSGSAVSATGGGAESGRSVVGRARPIAAAGVEQDGALVAKGRMIFEKTAGGVGCAFCHGAYGKGKAELASPNIRGKTAQDVFSAMETRAQMNIVKLSDDEVNAVVAYLAVLAGTP